MNKIFKTVIVYLLGGLTMLGLAILVDANKGTIATLVSFLGAALALYIGTK